MITRSRDETPAGETEDKDEEDEKKLERRSGRRINIVCPGSDRQCITNQARGCGNARDIIGNDSGKTSFAE